MTIPKYLADLPQINPDIRGLESLIIADPRKRYLNVAERTAVNTPSYRSWMDKELIRYDIYLKAGRDSGRLPQKRQPTIDPPSDDEPTPFSPLAMEAALDICGYSRPRLRPADLRLLAQALENASKAELVGFFVAPDAALEDVYRHELKNRAKTMTLQRAGERAALNAKLRIIDILTATSTWATAVDFLDHVDWDDERLLMNLASDPTYTHKEVNHPLCGLISNLDRLESASDQYVRILFKRWWNKDDCSALQNPSESHKLLRAKYPEAPDRWLQIRSGDRISRFEQAVARICHPSLFPAIPYRISLLDFEQLLIAKPGRAELLPESLMRAIGHHATVIYANEMLHTIIHRKASASPSWEAFRNGQIRPLSHPAMQKLSDDLHAKFYIPKNRIYNRTQRLSWFTHRTHPINWAHYLTIDRTTLMPHLDGLKLKNCLDFTTNHIFGCDLVQLFDRISAGTVKDIACTGQDYADVAHDIIALVQLHENKRSAVTEMSDIRVCFEPRQEAPLPPPGGLPSHGPLRSAPLAQGGHAYLRENHPNMRGQEAAVPPDDPAADVAKVESVTPNVRFRVHNGQLKVVARLFGLREGNVKWAELINLFRRIGFRVESMGGSAYHVTPVHTSTGGKSILLYRPHPTPILTSEKAGAIGRELQSTFGWTADSFVRYEEELAQPQEIA